MPKEKPGTESHRKDRVIVTKYVSSCSIIIITVSCRYEHSLALFSCSLDKMHQALTELCASYSICADFTVFKHIIVPAEFLLSQLEIRLNKYCSFLSIYYMKLHCWQDEVVENPLRYTLCLNGIPQVPHVLRLQWSMYNGSKSRMMKCIFLGVILSCKVIKLDTTLHRKGFHTKIMLTRILFTPCGYCYEAEYFNFYRLASFPSIVCASL